MYDRLLNQRDLSSVREFFTDDVVYHGGAGTGFNGLTGLVEFVEADFRTFPDMAITVEELIAEGDRVAARYTYRGTHEGDLDGIPPSHVRVESPGITIFRLENGLIAEEWEVFDDHGLLGQIQGEV